MRNERLEKKEKEKKKNAIAFLDQSEKKKALPSIVFTRGPFFSSKSLIFLPIEQPHTKMCLFVEQHDENELAFKAVPVAKIRGL